MCGIAQCGDQCGDSVNLFYWQVQIDVSIDSWIYAQCGQSQCGDAIIDTGSAASLICFLNKYKPAHTQIIYTFTGVEFSAAFSNAFDSIPSDSDAWLQGAFSSACSNAFDIYLLDDEFSSAFDTAFDIYL